MLKMGIVGVIVALVIFAIVGIFLLVVLVKGYKASIGDDR